MSAKYFFRTTDEDGELVAFDIDRVIGVSTMNGHCIVTIDARSETIRQVVTATAEDVLLAIQSKTVRP
jgi:hypothetical protein